MSLSETPIQQGCVAFVRVSGRNNGAHVDRITMSAKVQACPCERYIFAVESQGEASVNNITHRVYAILDQELHLVFGDVEDLRCNPQFVEYVQPLAFGHQITDVLVALLHRPQGPGPNVLRLANLLFR